MQINKISLELIANISLIVKFFSNITFLSITFQCNVITASGEKRLLPKVLLLFTDYSHLIIIYNDLYSESSYNTIYLHDLFPSIYYCCLIAFCHSSSKRCLARKKMYV